MQQGLSMIEAIQEAVTHLMAEIPGMRLVGPGLATQGGAFRVLSGLEGVEGRVFDLPEEPVAALQIARGMHAQGAAVIVEVPPQWALEVAVALRQFPAWGGEPLIVRIPYNQTGEVGEEGAAGLLPLLVGLEGVVAIPSRPADLYGAIVAAGRRGGLSVILEPVALYRRRGLSVWEAPPQGDIGTVREVAPARRLWFVSWGAGVEAAYVAAGKLGGAGDIGVLDIRSLQPFDAEGVGRAVAAVGRVVVVDGGDPVFAAWLAAEIAAQAFWSLEAPVGRAVAEMESMTEVAFRTLEAE